MDALGSVTSYVREDEQLQLSAALVSEELTPAHLGTGVSAGELSLMPSDVGWATTDDWQSLEHPLHKYGHW